MVHELKLKKEEICVIIADKVLVSFSITFIILYEKQPFMMYNCY